MQKRVKVKPNSKQQKIEESADGSLTVHLKSPPVDGKANEELIKLLAKIAQSFFTLAFPYRQFSMLTYLGLAK